MEEASAIYGMPFWCILPSSWCNYCHITDCPHFDFCSGYHIRFRKRESQLREDPPHRTQLSRLFAMTDPYPHCWWAESQLAPNSVSLDEIVGLWQYFPPQKSQLSYAACPWLTTAPLPQENKHSEGPDFQTPPPKPRQSDCFYDEAALKHPD